MGSWWSGTKQEEDREREEREQRKREEREQRDREERERIEREERERIERKLKEFTWNIGLEIEWTTENLKKLQKRIRSQPTNAVLRILLFGQTGHGKSSLANGFRSALSEKPEVSHFYQTGKTSEGSFSRGILGALYGENQQLSILDMSGIYESDNFRDDDLRDILSGKVPFDQELTEHLQVLDRENMIIPEPGTNDVSCVVVVARPDKEFGPVTKRHLGIVNSFAKNGLISRRLVLTHIDKIDPLFADPKELPNFLQSEHIKRAVMTMAERTGIPPTAISVVRNYSNESFTNLQSNILLLHALNSIVYDASEAQERRNQKRR